MGAGVAELLSYLPDLLEFGCLEPAYLLFERPDAGDLTHSGRNTEWQKVPRNVECPSGKITTVRFDFHLGRTGQNVLEMRKCLRMNLPVGAQQLFGCLRIESPLI